jgi:hypothetical protein
MAEQNWWQRTVIAVNREYERRIRRASLITEYGVAGHADHGHSMPPLPTIDEEAAAIVNVPKGTPVARPHRPAPPPDSEAPSS